MRQAPRPGRPHLLPDSATPVPHSQGHITGVAECLGASGCRWQPAGACEGKERQAEKAGGEARHRIAPQCECHRINCTNAPESAGPPNPSPRGRALAGSHSLSVTPPYFLGTYSVAGGVLLRGGSVSRQDLCPQHDGQGAARVSRVCPCGAHSLATDRPAGKSGALTKQM